MATRGSPDIYACTLGPHLGVGQIYPGESRVAKLVHSMPVALGLGHIYQANPSWPWYKYYIHNMIDLILQTYLTIKVFIKSASLNYTFYSGI